jgi:hypothetical protein
MKLPEHMTIGEKYGPAMKITDPKEAAVYWEACVQHTMKYGNVSRKEAESIERQNFGYFAGYYDTATRERVERLFGSPHPIIGSVQATPSPEEIIELGRKWAA